MKTGFVILLLLVGCASPSAPEIDEDAGPTRVIVDVLEAQGHGGPRYMFLSGSAFGVLSEIGESVIRLSPESSDFNHYTDLTVKTFDADGVVRVYGIRVSPKEAGEIYYYPIELHGKPPVLVLANCNCGPIALYTKDLYGWEGEEDRLTEWNKTWRLDTTDVNLSNPVKLQSTWNQSVYHNYLSLGGFPRAGGSNTVTLEDPMGEIRYYHEKSRLERYPSYGWSTNGSSPLLPGEWTFTFEGEGFAEWNLRGTLLDPELFPRYGMEKPREIRFMDIPKPYNEDHF